MSFLELFPPHGSARNERVREAIAAGIDGVTWFELKLGRVTILVSDDWLKIGGARIPMTAANAQAAVDALGAVLPTPAIVEAIEAAARACEGLVPFDAWPRYSDNSQLERSTIQWREANIARRLAGRVPRLLAGAVKDVVLAPFMPAGRVVIFGGVGDAGKRIQPVYPIPGGAPGHGDYFDGGYGHGVRAVRDACLLDGEPTTVTAILSGPDAALLGGPVARLRYASPLRPEPPIAPAPQRTLRRGDHGPDVQELQHLLGLADHRTTIDGVFGRLTEEAVKAFQEERGLEVDGVVGVETWAALRDEPPPTERAPAYPFVQARNYHSARTRPIRAVVLHTMEAAEKATTAESVAAWFAGPSAPMASAHFCIDADSVVQCVREEHTAFAAPGLNADGLQLELAGYAGQGVAGWADDYSQALLRRAAALVADLCRRHHLPVVALDAAALLRGERGITTHAAVTEAYRLSTHTDPGPSFPMVSFHDLVRQNGG